MKVHKAKALSKFLAPIGLIFLWACLLVIHIVLFDKSFTLISHSFSGRVFPDKQLLRDGDTLNAQFTAQENHLGIVSANFHPHTKIEKGAIIFRIKEKGSNNWYYENAYDLRQISELPHYPFGFPIIDNSKNKIFHVEIELDNPKMQNHALKIDNTNSSLNTYYKFPKSEVLASYESLITFLSKKAFNVLKNSYQLYITVIYLYPFIFYLGKKIIKHSLVKKIFSIILVTTSLIDIVFMTQFFSLIYLTITILWLYVKLKTKDGERQSYTVGLILLTSCIIFQSLHLNGITEKTAVWAYMYLFVGLYQSIRNTNA